MANTEIVRTTDLVIATWSDVVMWIGSGKADERQIGTLHRALDHTAEAPGLLLWLPHRAAAPQGPARAAAGKLFREVGPRLRAFTLITEGGGFWASAIRSIVTGLSLAARTRFPFKAVPTIDEAAPWLMDRMGIPDEARTFHDHATSIRNSIEQWEPPE